MKIFRIITIHPAFVEAYFSFGAFRSCREKNLAQCQVIDLRDFAVDCRGSVDDRPYGGGDGMVMRIEPLVKCLESFGRSELGRVIYTAPGGKPWTQTEAQRFSKTEEPLTWVCGRFGGIDQRFLDHFVDDIFSLGDFVLTGGELPVLAMLDSILRLVPGALGHSASAQLDSFCPQWGERVLEHPLYTRPPEFRGLTVPEVLLSGDHHDIAQWQKNQRQVRSASL